MTVPPDRDGSIPPSSVEPDVERLHRAILREPADPREGREPAPWWVVATAVAALFWGGWYLGRYSGPFGAASHMAFPERPAPASVVLPPADPVALGKSVFMRNCQACHQANGRGVPGAFPPLVGSEWVTGAPEVVARILLDGLQGPVGVAGASFDGAMPAWRNALSDGELAAVLTYVRQWKPNAAGPVQPSLFVALRAETAGRGHSWTASELQALPKGRAP